MPTARKIKIMYPSGEIKNRPGKAIIKTIKDTVLSCGETSTARKMPYTSKAAIKKYVRALIRYPDFFSEFQNDKKE